MLAAVQKFFLDFSRERIWQMKKIETRMERKIVERMIQRMIHLGKYHVQNVSIFTGISRGRIEKIASGRSIRATKFKSKGEVSKWRYRKIFCGAER